MNMLIKNPYQQRRWCSRELHMTWAGTDPELIRVQKALSFQHLTMPYSWSMPSSFAVGSYTTCLMTVTLWNHSIVSTRKVRGQDREAYGTSTFLSFWLSEKCSHMWSTLRESPLVSASLSKLCKFYQITPSFTPHRWYRPRFYAVLPFSTKPSTVELPLITMSASSLDICEVVSWLDTGGSSDANGHGSWHAHLYARHGTGTA